ncbi:AraC family transcriptional regulator [Nevskia sp.]|uniref:AraC family transcriptional regulator n=1 Tax=Nevskia sp. TaxID=1929292 RepID=UPI003F6ECB71
MSEDATTINTWAIALVRTLDARGCAGRALLAEAGLDPALLGDPNGRVPVSGMVRLWRLAVAATGDPCLGLKVAAYVQPATFHSLGLALLASQTLEDALLRSARYSRIVSNAVEVRIERGATEARQIVEWRMATPVVEEAIDLVMASTVKMGLLLLAIDPAAQRPMHLRLRRAATPAMRAEFAAHFACPIDFEAGENSLALPLDWLDRPLPMANPQLARQNDLVVMEYLARHDGSRLAEKVRALLVSRLPAGEPARAEVAQALLLSEKTLQRRLRDEDTSYQQLLDDLRRDLAQKYLREPAASVCEVTFRLGFSDQSSFTRAFRRWTGVTPGEYRSQPDRS